MKHLPKTHEGLIHNALVISEEVFDSLHVVSRTLELSPASQVKFSCKEAELYKSSPRRFSRLSLRIKMWPGAEIYSKWGED